MVLPLGSNAIDPFANAAATSVWSVNQWALHCTTLGAQIRLDLKGIFIWQGYTPLYPPLLSQPTPRQVLYNERTLQYRTHHTKTVFRWETHLVMGVPEEQVDSSPFSRSLLDL